MIVLNVGAHLDWSVVWAMPEVDLGVERTALGSEVDLDLLDRR